MERTDRKSALKDVKATLRALHDSGGPNLSIIKSRVSRAPYGDVLVPISDGTTYVVRERNMWLMPSRKSGGQS